MRRIIMTLALVFALAASGAANTVIFKDKTGAVNLFKNSTHYKANDKTSNFIFVKKILEGTQEVILSENNDELWGAYVTDEALSLLYSLDQGYSFKKISTSFKLKNSILEHYINQNSSSHFIYKKNNRHYYTHSNDKGISFSPSLLLYDGLTKNSDFKKTNNLIAGALLAKDGKAIYCFESINQGMTFSKTEIYLQGFNQLEEISLYIDNENRPHLFTVGFDNNKYQLYHFEKNNSEWKSNLLYESGEKIYQIVLNPIIETSAVLLNFKEGKSDYWSISVDKGESISFPKEILTKDKELFGLFHDDQKIYWASINKLEEITNNVPDPVQLLSPENQAKINSTSLNIKLNGKDKDENSLIFKVDLSLDKDFEKGNILSFYLISGEATINSPFSSGIYYLRASASDGIAYGDTSLSIEITVDMQAPKIEYIEYPKTINIDNINIKIAFNEPVTFEALPIFLLENSQVSQLLDIKRILANKTSIEAQVKIPAIKDGTYNLKISNISDEAGNPLETDDKLTLSVDHQSPMLEIARPQNSDWYKADATLLIDIKVNDLQNDIPPDPEIILSIDKQISKTKILYNKNKGKLFGFLSLANDVTNGKHSLEIEIKDSAGNIGKAQTIFFVDSIAPQAISPSFSIDKIIIPYVENGSGVDTDSSIIEITLGSKEVEGTIEAQDNEVLFYPQSNLIDGSYEIKVSLRDYVGNSASTQSFKLLVKDGVTVKDATTKNVTSFRYGPNPFNPEREEWKLQYSISSPAEIKFFIFTLTGRNIFRSHSPTSSSHTLTWNGKDQFGNLVYNGVYLFAVLRGSEIQRGKIIVLR